MGISFENKIHIAKEWFGKSKWELKCPFSNLPYLEHDGKVITQTHAIIEYIVYISGREDLLGKNDED